LFLRNLFPPLVGFFSHRSVGYATQKEPRLTKKHSPNKSKNITQTAS